MKGHKCLALALAPALLLTACKSKQARKADHLAKAAALEAKHDYANTILEYRILLSLDPRDAQAHYKLGVAYLETKQYSNAAQEFKAALALDRNFNDARIQLAAILSATNDPSATVKARDLARQAVAAGPGNPNAREVLAFSDMKLGNVDESIAELERVLRTSPQRLKSAMMLSSIRLRGGDKAGAEAVLKAAIAADPKSPDAYIALGQFYIQSGRKAEAEQIFRTALEKGPDNPAALLALGALQREGNRQTEAEATYLRLSRLPEPAYRSAFATFLIRTGQVDRGIAELERLAKLYPKDRAIGDQLVSTYARTGHHKEAYEFLGARVASDEHDAYSRIQRARLALLGRHPEQAEEDLRKVIEGRAEGEAAEAHTLLALSYGARGMAARQRGETRLAIEALRTKPDALNVRLTLSQLLAEAGQLKQALDLLEGAPASQRNLPAILARKNWIGIRMNQWALVKDGVDRGLKSYHTPEFLLQQAVLDTHLKNYAEAQLALDELRPQRGDDPRVIEAQFSLAEARLGPPAAMEGLLADARRRRSPQVQVVAARLLAQRGRLDEAQKALTEAAELAPGQGSIAVLQAMLELRQHKFDVAERRLTALLSDPAAGVQATEVLADLRMATGNVPQAIELYRRVAAAQPNNLLALNNLSYALALDPARLDEAGQILAHAMELDPEQPMLFDTQGLIAYQRRHYPEALRWFQQATAKQINPTRQAHLDMARMMTGDRAQAVARLRQIRDAGGVPGVEIALINRALGDPAGQR